MGASAFSAELFVALGQAQGDVWGMEYLVPWPGDWPLAWPV